MADKKTKDETHVAYAGLVAKHILRGASDDATGNFFIYFSELIEGVLGYTSYTVAAAQAAAIALEFIPGQRIKITDPYSDSANEFRTIAKSTSELETRGHGIYQNSVMSAPREFEMGYTLSDDHIYYLYDQKFNNECRQVGITMIDNIPFDAVDAGRGTPGDLPSANIKHNYFENITFTLGDTQTQIQNSEIINSIVTTSDTTSGNYGCLIWNCNFNNGTISMIARNVGGIFLPGWGAVLIGSLCQDLEISAMANVTNDGAELHGKITGAGITLDTSSITSIAPGYIGYGILNFQGSTFGVTGYQVPAINPDGGGNSDFSACPWAGSARITDTTTSGGNFNQIINHSGVKLRIYLENGIGTALTFLDGAGNIKTPNGAPVALTPGKGDWLDLQGKILDPGNFTIMDYANYM